MPQIVRPEKRANDIRALLEKHKGQLTAALPRQGLTADRLVRVALTAITRTPKLLEADLPSLYAAILQSAQLGLQPDGALGEAHLVPFENRKRGVVEVQFIPGYRGLLSLVRRSGDLSTVEVRAVYFKDFFRFEYGIAPVLKHTPWDPGLAADPTQYDDEASYTEAVSAGPLVAVYAIAHLKDGGVQWDVMRRHEVNAIRARSKARDSGPWVTDYDAMAKKTVLKRLCKLLPMSVEAMTAMDLDDKAEVGIPQDLEIPPGVKAEEDDAPNGGSALSQLTQTIKARTVDTLVQNDPDESTASQAPVDALPLEDATPPASEIPWDGQSELAAPPDKPTKRGK